MSMTLIGTVTLSSTNTTITFSSIPQTMTDLMLVRSMLSDSSAGPASSANITFNGSSAGYSERILYNNISGGGASGIRSGTYFDWAGLTAASGSGSTANTFSSGTLYIPNYTSANAKIISSDAVQETNSSNGSYWNYYSVAGLWSGTAAITSITLTSSAGNFVTGSTVSLYGITKGTLAGVTVA